MKNFSPRFYFAFLLLIISFAGYSQNTGDCAGASNICTNASFNVSPNGSGNTVDFTSTSNVSNPTGNPAGIVPPGGFGCLLSGELNSTWMIINVQTSGTLQFSFGAGTGAGAQAGCYDWSMWPYTATTCTQINNNTLGPVACCWNSPCSGGTGMAAPGNIPAGGSATNFVNALNVTCGQKFIVCLSNYSSLSTNIPLNFFGSAQVSCNPIPNPVTVQSKTICAGSSAVLTATAAASNTYTWNPGGTTGTNPSITVSPTVTTTYTVSASGGCGNQTGTTTAVVTVNNAVSTLTVANGANAADPTPKVQCVSNDVFNFSSTTTSGTHSWNFGGGGASPATSTAQNPSGISYSTPGTYTVTHTVTSGTCTAVSTTTVQITAPPTTTITSTSTCPGFSTGTASVTAAGGTPAYTYAWSPVAGSGTSLSGLANGTYSVTITDASGCATVAVTTVSLNPQPSAVLTVTNPTCGFNNGIIQISNTSGAGQTVTSFSLNNSTIATQTISSLAAGNYSVTLANNFGCKTTVTTALINSPPITALATTTINPTCGLTNGSIGLGVVTGGTGPYTYNVNGGAYSATPPLTNLGPGVYSIGVMDSKGCTFVKTVTLTNIPGPTALSFTTSPSTCLGAAGSVSIGVTGGTPAYSYSVDGSTTGSTASGLANGVHTATVKDVNGCIITATFNITVLSGPTAATTATSNATCNLSNGSATVTGVTGGTAPYQYSFNGGAFVASNNISGLSAGTKTVVVKDANGCLLTVTFNINQTGNPSASVLATNNVSCNGGSNGSFTVSATGGLPGYSYTLTPGGTSNGTGIFSGLTAQNYTVTIKDAVGCSVTVTNPISQPVALTLTLTPFAVSCNAGANGSITAVAANGTSPYQYSLNGGVFGGSSSFTGLVAGTYSVTVRDNNNCTLTQTITITQPPALALSFTTTPNTCLGGAGSVTVGVTGGTPGFSYSVDAVATGSTATGLSTGNHTALVVDSKGCPVSSSFNIGIISGMTSASVFTTNATCGNANGSATVTSVVGGTAPYQYSFNGGAFGASTNSSGLAAGTHTVTVKDNNNCLLTITFNINNTGSPVASIAASSNVSCNGGANGSFTVSTSGGSPGYTYTLNPTGSTNAIGVFTGLTAQNYTVTVKDAVGCITTVTNAITQPPVVSLTLTPFAVSCNAGSNGSITATAGGGVSPYQFSLNGSAFGAGTSFTGLSAGVYSVTVRDNNNCTRTQTVTITQPLPLSISFTTSPTACVGSTGSSTITVSGGTPVYSYSVNAASTGSVVGALGAGNYTVTVIDANSCPIGGNFNVAMVSGPTAGSALTGNATCGSANGSATVTSVTGGAAPYQYSFNGGAFSLTNNTGGLSAGTQTVVIKDANGCTFTINPSVNNTGSPSSSITGSVNVSCFGGANGSFSVNTTGGVGPYTYTLSPGGTTNGTGVFSSLSAQGYNVTVKDAVGCVTTVSVTINQPTALSLTLSPLPVSCNGGANGTITAAAAGGTTPYQYSINGGAFSGSTNYTGLTAGTYSITVRDNNNCSLTQTTQVTQPPAISMNFTTIPNSCAGTVGSVTVGVTGGTPVYSYSVNGSASANTATGLSSGSNNATVQDNNGCVLTSTFNIASITGPSVATVGTSNASCGNANGSATVTSVSGGLAPYQYSFNGSSISLSNNASGLAPGVQTVIVVDANGCTFTVNPTINNTGSPTANISASSNVSCFNGTNGSFTVNTIGGVGPYSYTLSPGGTTNTTGVFTALPAQGYNVTVKDAVGCITTVTVTITQPTALSLSLAATAVNCNAGSNGSITAGAAGGTTPYQFNINGGAFSGATNYTGLTAGVYTLQVRDNNNCSVTQSIQVTQPTALSMNLSTLPNSCAGTVGSVTMTVAGGTPVYSYSVNGTATTNTTTSLTSGVHTALVMDNNGCVITNTFNIGSITGPVTATIQSTNSNCGNPNGSATVTAVSGGLAPYQYSFNGSTFSSSTIQAGFTPGTQSLVVLDANTCTVQVTFAIGNTGGPIPLIGNVSHVSCFGGANGSFTINTSGGTPGYNYTLTPGGNISGTGVFSSLPQGNYTALVKDAAGCMSSVTVTITEPSPLTLSLSSLPTSCNGGSDGSITALGNGGTGPYQYNLNGSAFQSSTTFTGVAAGVYNITVQDNKGCTLTQSVSVTQPSAITLITSSINSNCTAANGTASVSASGGTPAYTYTWSGGGGNSAQTTGLVAGTYTVTVADSKGCLKTAISTINASPGGTAVISSQVNVSCSGLTNGSMTAGTSGPLTPPLTYNWSNGQNTQTATNLTAGPYTVTITDVFGCTSSTVGTITQPSVLDLFVTTTSVSCFGGTNGSATANYLGGGTPPLTYMWSPGGFTTSIAPNLPQGVYTCTLTDALGCTAVRTGTITEPSSVTVTSSVTTANCNQSNGSATVSATGGTPAYTYTWSTGASGPSISGALAGTYTISVQDANGCLYTSAATIPNQAGPVMSLTSQTNVSCFGGNNGVATTTVSGGNPPYIYLWSNGQNGASATNLLAGVYTATVTDQMGCKSSVSVTISQPPAVTVNVSGTDPLCFGSLNGTANAGVLGGTPGYNYTWTPSGGNNATASGLGAGNYIVTVSDVMGCIKTGSVLLNNPPQMTASISSTNVTCFNTCNGMAVGSASNTVGAVTWFWTGGPGPLTTQNVSGLCAASYTLVATDQNGCSASAVANITQPTLLTSSISASGNVSCAGYTDGFATVAPGGGTPAYTYSWSPMGGSLATANNLPFGNYTVTVTDAMGCTTTTNVTITQPTPLLATLTSTNVTCNGANNGIGNLSYSGGTGPYTFLWFPGLSNTSSVNNLPPGTHTVEITDNLNCKTTRTVTITEPGPLSAVVTTSNSNCTQSNGGACVAASGGAGGFTYQWSSNPNFTLSCVNSVPAGAYTVTVTDANSCTVAAIANINDISGPSVAITATTAVSCFGGSNGSALATITGGTGTVSILWSWLGQSTSSVNNLPSGLHSITVMDQANCISSASLQITQPTQLTSAITNVTQIPCFGQNTGSATMLVNGGTPVYTYTWLPMNQSSAGVSNLTPGTHTCLVTDANGCPTSQQVVITQPAPLTIASSSVTNVLCNGNPTGQISVVLSGGTPVYSYTWTPAQPSNPFITNLPAGGYSLSATDSKGCPVSGSWNITQPPLLTSAATSSPATCGNATGAATVTANGGTPGYTYNWNTPTPQASPVATGMSSNLWSCVITDANGCSLTQTVNVANAPGPQVSSTSFTAPLCFGQQNGSMAVSFSSGTSPYTFVWNDPNASTTQTVNGVGAGVYTATVTDLYGCFATAVVNVVQPNQLVLLTSSSFTLCYGQTGQIYAQASGGTPAYTYSWNPSSFTGGGPHSVNPTSNTGYAVSVSDANGCTPLSSQNINIIVRPPLTAQGSTATICHSSQTTFSANMTSPGNGGPYTYQWSNGASSSDINVVGNFPTTPNVYSVTISDGCSTPAVAFFTADVNPLPSGNFSADILKGCQPLSVIFTATSSDSTDKLNWNFNNHALGTSTTNPAAVVYADAGFFSVDLLIINKYGCAEKYSKQNYIEVYQAPLADFSTDPNTTTELSPGINFYNQSMGATSYNWNFGDPASGDNTATSFDTEHIYSGPAEYTITLVATSDKGCKDTTQRVIRVTPEFAIYIPNTFTPDGNGKNDIFLPKGIGIDEDHFKMYIYDRWGEVIFTTNNFEQGWDGSVKGNNITAEQGVYIYKIYVRDLMGTDHEFTGHVNCLPKINKY